MGQLFILCTLTYIHHRLQQREVLSAQARSSLALLFCCPSLPTAKEIQERNKVFHPVYRNALHTARAAAETGFHRSELLL